MSRRLLIFSLSIILGLFMVLSPSLSALGSTNAQTRLSEVQNNQANNSLTQAEQARETRQMSQTDQTTEASQNY